MTNGVHYISESEQRENERVLKILKHFKVQGVGVLGPDEEDFPPMGRAYVAEGILASFPSPYGVVNAYFPTRFNGLG